ncbi:signal recognition particle-docking protein FtsY [Onishia niordana]|uniref:signal recognition particle-docking protein FtsY n=1 Tax=Onishia niordana TaxID=2508711 RepID=UPI00109F4A4D|nr:signal recognition particle-docking protein FtsY [Halomonas niordiana]
MFGLFKRKKKQDPSQQEQAPDQEVTPEASEDAADEATVTGTDTDERNGDTQQTAETPSDRDERVAPDEVSVEPTADTQAESESNEDDAKAMADAAAEHRQGDVSEQVAEQGVEQAPVEDALTPPKAPPEPEVTPSVAEAAPSSEPVAEEQPDPAALDPRPDQAPAPQSSADPEKGKKKGWFARIKEGLGKTRSNLSEGLSDLFLGKKQIDDELMEDLETQLLMADVGIEATTEIIDRLTARVSRKELKEPQALYDALQDELAALLEPVAKDLVLPEKGQGPFVILMVGVNGVGKTTTIGKLAKRFQGQGRSVMLAAGDTFRAAAVEQLKVWGERNSVPVVAQHTGSDSASVIYDALSAAKARGIDVLIADTAGRLHNKGHLMEELKKVQRVMAKLDAAAPHEVMLVLDAGTGQNALSQAATFNEAVPVTGITLTKLDGTAKGGIIFALAKQLGTPIRYIGVGETVDDLRPFAGRDFVDALFDVSRSE